MALKIYGTLYPQEYTKIKLFSGDRICLSNNNIRQYIASKFLRSDEVQVIL